MSRPRETPGAFALAVLISLGALCYAASVVGVAYRAPDKGFLAFTGRRVAHVEPGGPAERAGVREGDVVATIDGRRVLSTADYVARLPSREPGEVVTLGLERKGRPGVVEVALELERSPPPWAAMAATLLALVLLLLGLIARYGRPRDPAARRFWRVTVCNAMLFAGALSWVHLLVHPALLVLFFGALFLAAPLSLDLHLVFPSRSATSVRHLRWAWYAPALALLLGLLASLAWAVQDYRSDLATDRGFEWAVRLFAVYLVLVVLGTGLGFAWQLRRARQVGGAERGQLKWLLFGFGLSTVPTFLAVPVALADLEHFLLVGYRPPLIAVAVLWSAANALAVLRVRLADVDAVIHRSLAYAGAIAGALLLYLGVVLAVGVIAERLGGGALLPHLVAALAAAAMFGPIRDRFTRWLDRRFFRDRLHYLEALRDLSHTAARLREPPDLAREVVEGAATALRARSGALYLSDESYASEEAARTFYLAHAADGAGARFPGRLEPREALEPPPGGVSVPIGDPAQPGGALVFGPRRGGDLYSSEDRNLLSALAGQLAVSIENARAFGTIADMGRTLEKQNREIRELRDRLEDENLYLKRRLAQASEGEEIVGSSKAIRELRAQLERVAASPAGVLLSGESGTGKGLVARTLHASSDRAEGPFIHVDCGSIPPGVFESELFGHERGAFTGAVRKRRGHFELADGGTVFLDEIGELPLELQPKLLRAIEEQSFLRVGGGRPVEVDVRILAATNRDLEDMVRAGRFREDLYFRLRVVEIGVPPLRRRKSDIPALVEHVLPRICRRNHRAPVSVSPEALERLADYGWPGNVRELENVLERAVVLCEGRVIEADDLALDDAPPAAEELFRDLRLEDGAPHDEVMEAIEVKRLEAALRAAGGNQSSAARKLGMARTTLINKLRRYRML